MMSKQRNTGISQRTERSGRSEMPQTGEQMRNYYEILGVSQDATLRDIENAYQKLSLKWHPDKHTVDRRLAERKFHQISEAFDVLSDPGRRATYNQMMNQQSSLETAYRIFDRFFGQTEMLNEDEEKFFEKHFPDKRKNYYKILGVDRNATMQQITDAYRRLALKYHPKSNPNNEEAQRKFVQINEAYETLSKKGGRSDYDDLMFGSMLPRRAHDIFQDFFQDRWRDMPSQAEFFTPIFSSSRRRPWSMLGDIESQNQDLMRPLMDRGFNNLQNIREGQSIIKEERYEKKNGKQNHVAQTVKRKIKNGEIQEEVLKENWLPNGERDVTRTIKKGQKVDTKTYHLKRNENMPRQLTNY